MKLYQAIAQNEQLLRHKNVMIREYAETRKERILALLPNGSGFDNGTLIVEASEKRIVFATGFHHMDDNGFYCGWTQHRVVVRASLSHGFTLYVSGVNKRDIKDYISEVFDSLMHEEFSWSGS